MYSVSLIHQLLQLRKQIQKSIIHTEPFFDGLMIHKKL